MNRIIQIFQKHWHGPALTIEIAGKEIVLGQGQPTTRVVVKDPRILVKILRSPSLAFGEGYMKGDIVIEGELEDVLAGFYQTSKKLQTTWLTRVKNLLPDKISVKQAMANAQHHYDVGNEFYKLWLDPRMVYSCAVFLQESDTLAKAQEQKLDLLCRKVNLQRGQTLLDIGCGWGGLLFHAAEKYGAIVTGITPAKEQAAHIRAEIQKRGLEKQVTVIEGDWRTLEGHYDRIISVGMFEHVGQAQYEEFFAVWNTLLAPGGVSLLHTIGRMKEERTDPWVRTYIFPGGFLPTLAEVSAIIGSQGMVITDVENLWQHYAKTLKHWSQNFLAARDQVVAMHGEEFARMWYLYLEGSRAGFLYGSMQLWQIVILKDKSSPWPLNRGDVHTPNERI